VPTKQNTLRPAIASGQAADWPHNDPLHDFDLDEVIEYLERMFVEKNPNPESAKNLLSLIREATQRVGIGHEPANRDNFKKLGCRADELPDEPTFAEKLGDLLPVVWADYRLWQAFTMKPPGSAILKNALAAYLLLKFYNLQIPFQDSVWLELRGQTVKWNYLQFLMASHAHNFFHLESASGKDVLGELFLGKLLLKYVRHPLNDYRPLLSTLGYPAPVLRRLSQAAANLSKDAAWAAKNPDRYVAGRAPTATHRVRNLREAKAIEDMVVILRQNIGISDYALAKKGLGRISAAGRKLAKEAKLLALCRERLPVKIHKSRGDKKAPTTSA
jgi:hypothetical protein